MFYFSKYPDIPLDSDSTLEQAVAESADLREFLSCNDLETLLPFIFTHDLMCISGHVFKENTLPKPQPAPVNAPVEVPAVNAAPPKVVPPTPVTPQNPTSSTQPTSSGSGRMVTRVSSGAIRHKSIGEILGEKEVFFLSYGRLMC
jgi:hypothetical protein